MSDEPKDKDDKAWLGIVTGQVDGQWTLKQLPEGFMFVIHESGMKETAILGMVKIRLKNLDAVCMCGNPRCTLKLRLRVEKTGHHPLMDEGG